MDHTALEDVEPIILASVTELQRQLNDALQQLSPEGLQVVADFVADRENIERDAATQDLLAIPQLLERVQHNQATPTADYSNWRTLRSDV
jgi:hypothetical protein